MDIRRVRCERGPSHPYKAESTDRLVAQYNVRLLQTERSERVPSGLLVAEYGEHQMVGEKDNGLEQTSVLMGDSKK